MELLALDDDALEAILCVMETNALATLMCTCKQLETAIKSQPLLDRLCDLRSITRGPSVHTVKETTHFHCSADFVDSLEALAIIEAMQGDMIGGNHITFHLASVDMTAPSEELLARYAGLLRRHPRLRLRLDSHTGVGAPAGIHASHSVRRAQAVADWLLAHDVDAERISACAWGYRVGQKRRWPASSKFARVELFVAFPKRETSSGDAGTSAGGGDGGDAGNAELAGAAESVEENPESAPAVKVDPFDRSRCLPEWPNYYESVTPVNPLFTFSAEGRDVDVDESDDEDGEGQGGLPHIFQMMQMLQGMGPGQVVELANGQQFTAPQFLALLQGHMHGGGGGNDGDSDGEDDGDDEDDDGDEEEDDGDDDDDGADSGGSDHNDDDNAEDVD